MRIPRMPPPSRARIRFGPGPNRCAFSSFRFISSTFLFSRAVRASSAVEPRVLPGLRAGAELCSALSYEKTHQP